MSSFRFLVLCALTVFSGLYSSRLSAQKIFDVESYYSTGYYYLPDSTKKSGLIKYTFQSPTSFRFKDSLTAKAVTITADECIGFHEDGDKADFQTLSNVKLPISMNNAKFSKCFGELRINGALSLYLVYFEKRKPGSGTFIGGPAAGGTYGGYVGGVRTVATSRYILKKKNSDIVQEVPKKAKHFKKELSEFLSDKPGVVEFINSHNYTDDEIEMVVQAYNYSK